MNEGGIIILITAPSGSGKTTIYKKLLKKRQDISFSVSCTTRKKRIDETEGVDYHFIDMEEFKKKIRRGAFVEWAKVHGDLYGTEKEHLKQCLQRSKICLLDLDVQGALNIMKQYPSAVTIFIEPPSLEELKRRLEMRGTESPGDIELRLMNAERELEYKSYFNYIVVNDRVDRALHELERIIEIELKKRR